MIADLVAYLGNASAVSSLVSSRIYPQLLPQSPTLPALTYSQISAIRTYVLAGDVQKARRRFQIDCWAATHKASAQLADAVRNTLSGFYGSMSGTQVHFITLDNEHDLFDEQAGTTGVYRITQDYIISHLED